MRTRTFAALAATLMLLMACGADDGEADADVEEPTGAAEESGLAETTVEIVDDSFEPGVIEVALGDTVRWTHTGELPHTVTFEDGPDSGNLGSGDEYSHTFEAAGEYAYACSIHPAMQGSVTVTG